MKIHHVRVPGCSSSGQRHGVLCFNARFQGPPYWGKKKREENHVRRFEILISSNWKHKTRLFHKKYGTIHTFTDHCANIIQKLKKKEQVTPANEDQNRYKQQLKTGINNNSLKDQKGTYIHTLRLMGSLCFLNLCSTLIGLMGTAILMCLHKYIYPLKQRSLLGEEALTLAESHRSNNPSPWPADWLKLLQIQEEQATYSKI